MNNQTNIKAVITADDRASRTLNNFGDNVSKNSSKIGKAAKVGAAGIAALAAAAVAFGIKSVKAFTESENVMAQTQAVIKSTGGVAGVTAGEVSTLASSLQRVTKFSDETIQTGENLLLTFTKIGKDIFPQATETMLNMSQALGQDVKASAVQLGKALNDPIRGVTALRRVGVSFTADQEKVIASLVNTGRSAEAQKLILKELETEFGGSARAAGETFSGKLEILKNNFDDLQERVGAFLVNSLTPLVVKLNELVSNVNINSGSVSRFKGVLIAVGDYISNVLSTAIAVFRGGLQLLQPLFEFLRNQVSTQLVPALRRLWEQVGPLLTPAAKVLGAIVGGLLVGAIGDLTLIILGAVIVLTALANTIARVISWVKTAIGWVRSFGSSVISFVAGPVNTAIRTVSNLINTFNRLRGSIGAAMSGVANTIIGPFRSAFNAIVSLWNSTVGRINFSIPDWVPELGGKSWGMPRFAQGVRNFSGGLAMVGEQGPEIVSLPKGSDVYSNSDSRKMMGGAPSISLNVNIGLYAGSEIEKRRVAKELYESLKEVMGPNWRMA